MKPSKLRSWMKKYGDVGVLAVASYLALQHLWTKRRSALAGSFAVVSILSVILALRRPVPIRHSFVHPPLIAQPDVAVSRARPDTSLLQRATRVLTQRHIGKTYLDWRYGYQWVSNSRLLLLRMLPFDEDIVRPLTYVSYDLKQRTETELKAVNASLNTSVGQLCEWECSSNRHWLLVHVRDGACFLHLDGTGLHVCTTSSRFDEDYWVDEGRHWLDAYGGMNGGFLDYPALTIYDSASLQPVKKIVNTNLDPLLLSRGKGQHSLALSSRDGQQLLTLNVAGTSGAYDITHTALILIRDWKDGARPAQAVTMPLPEEGRVVEASFSPDTKKVAYILLTEAKRSNAQGQAAKGADDVDGALSLCVSDWESGRSHRIGSVPCQFSEFGYDEERYPSMIQWLPDGRHISFVYNDSLWTVPVSMSAAANWYPSH